MVDIKNAKVMKKITSNVIVDQKINKNGIEKYHVTIEQINVSRFLVITEIRESNEKRRLIVPMKSYQRFFGLLKLGLEMGDPSSYMKEALDIGLVYTLHMDTEERRLYHMDIFVVDGNHYVRVNYMYRRDYSFVNIDIDSLKTVVEIIEIFEKRMQTLMSKDGSIKIRQDRWRTESDSSSYKYGIRIFNIGVYYWWAHHIPEMKNF
ncbi:hypothetical protein RF11_03312 [Thelohanellus kitauei]|uniref:Uncharacterized protein n=1 Tax=Thelohanellus kitauei TaxID=669202 RepID=A0A0C2N2T5_THEKT|nr:hypothetical protein RF11_03312 [Thelohanellus kitauei]